MAKWRVVVTDQVFPDVDTERELLASIDAELVVAEGGREDALQLAREADGLLNTYLPIDADFLGQLERCRIVARYGIGVDNIDLAAAEDAGVVVTNVPDYCVEEVATHALAMLLSLVRRLPEADAQMREGAWGVDGIRPVNRFSELTVGLLGYGRIARTLAGYVRALGAQVIAHDPFVDDVDDGTRLVGFDELLSSADAVSLHAPLTEGTRGIIDASALVAMRDHAVLVNTSRGPLVVHDDLTAALRSGEIRAAALDVFEHEPPDPSSVEGVPGLLTSPHTAFYSEAALAESQRKATTQIIRVLSGEPAEYAVNA